MLGAKPWMHIIHWSMCSHRLVAEMSETKVKQCVLELLLVENSIRVLVRNFEKLLRSHGSSNLEPP
jgi:hypothetical protein